MVTENGTDHEHVLIPFRYGTICGPASTNDFSGCPEQPTPMSPAISSSARRRPAGIRNAYASHFAHWATSSPQGPASEKPSTIDAHSSATTTSGKCKLTKVFASSASNPADVRGLRLTGYSAGPS